MAVTKTVAPEFINHAISRGINLIGENRVQELLSKKDDLCLDGVAAEVLSEWEVRLEQLYECEPDAGLGNGGLCLNCPVCHFPNCGFGKGR